ncbi:pentapeptide repeat-containing protein [Streptomyces sp. NBC_00047]|uniref:pentapeptide repeat-containing protein n=1 Tax=Streptomyces sp. NBC_00047 TaxID=2975627 RepID=UPI00224DD91F|nr:pentapeptide repeat-containing protein [Streptomyces sp. NBC_00047]MCX5612987.1 pentapeptide repeat-containing protein [Streptomyces sp. NBC_00047]
MPVSHSPTCPLQKFVLSNLHLSGADLTGADVTEADLSEVRGLTAEQVLTAHLARSTGLPADLRTDPAVLARID